MSAHITTDGGVDEALLRSRDSGPDMMFDDRQVDFSLLDEELWSRLATALAGECFAQAGFGEGPVEAVLAGLFEASHRLGNGVETRSFVITASDATRQSVEWAARQGLEVLGPSDEAGRPSSPTFRVRLVDARPSGVAIVCDRRL